MSESNIFIFAGETSADLYGGKLLAHLKKQRKSHFWGVGGPALEQAGLSYSLPMRTFQVMGLSDVIQAAPRLIRSFYQLKGEILSRNPELCLFIDQPSFSIKLAKRLRRSGYKGKIVQFVAPTVWAYNAKRANLMAESFDLLLTLFPFEPACFAHTSLKTLFVGHPIIELIDEAPSTSLPIDPTRPLLSIFPGSRPDEVRRNLHKQLQAAQLFCIKYPDTQLAVSAQKPIPSLDPAIHQVPFDKRYELMRRSRLALAKSGTVTLELALCGVPTVVSYELSLLNYLMAKYVMKLSLPYYSIVNILAKKELFPERIRPPVTSQEIADCLIKLQSDPDLYRSIKEETVELRRQLLSDQAPSLQLPSFKACEAICELL